jgi:hypothetical protein
VIEFRSQKEYGAFQPRPAADAFFVGEDAADYIVMPRSGVAEFQVAAHEYSHVVLHSLDVQLPPWFAEGLAELFSTIRIRENGCSIGGDLPARSQALRQRPWIPLPRLLALTSTAAVQLARTDADTFYAESWALTQMLAFSPNYKTHLKQLWTTLSSGSSDPETIAAIYGKPLSAIAADLRGWALTPEPGVTLPGVPAVNHVETISFLSGFESRMVIAELLLACGNLKRTEILFKALANEQPQDPRPQAALGSIAAKKGNTAEAREYWKRSIELGIRDAYLCYRYAVSADDAGVEAVTGDIRSALQRAIELSPDFADARYRLALLESNHAQYPAALLQLRAMRSVPAGRAYAYWTAMATALTETDQREKAVEAAHRALAFASNADERDAARRLALVAQTDLTVQFARDAAGNLQVVTARKPHGSENWNPFIEPGDRIRSLAGRIRNVQCSAGRITGFRIESASQTVEVALPDPSHVLIGGGTAEFVCDGEDGRSVVIEYAASQKPGAPDGILRGMRFQ